jgi:hypothetical protein
LAATILIFFSSARCLRISELFIRGGRHPAWTGNLSDGYNLQETAECLGVCSREITRILHLDRKGVKSQGWQWITAKTGFPNCADGQWLFLQNMAVALNVTTTE